MRRILPILVVAGALALSQQATFAQTGACCSLVTGECTVTTEADCIDVVNGTYQGDDIPCEGIVCPTPIGACCIAADGQCLLVTEANCTDFQGTYQGNATSCEPNMCPQPTGACCDGLFGGCDQVTEAECSPGNLGIWQGAGTDCETAGCGEGGSCCNPPTGQCLFRAEAYCDLIGRNFIGEGIECEPNMCPQPPTGACCQESGECQSDYSESDCVNQTSGGVWAGPDTTCDPENPCEQPAFGACCFGTGGCIVTAEYLCADGFGQFQGEDSTCYPTPCDSNQIVGWCDNLDSYEDGTQLYEIEGWTGWDGVQSAAGYVSNDQARSAPNSIDVGGFKDAVHPFETAFEGGEWEIVAWQYIPSNLSSTTYFIVNSYYEHGGPYFTPVQLEFVPGSSDHVYDALRDSNATTTLPIVYDQWVEIRIEADFENDWPGNPQSVGTIRQYYNGQLLLEGSWIPIDEGIFVGQLAIMNIDLYAPHAESVYYDDLCVEIVSESELNPTRPLFVGTTASSGGLPTRTSDLSGAPAITWNDGFDSSVGIEGAAARPDGAIYLAGTESGSFRPNLFIAAFEGPALPVCEFGTSFTAGPSGLAYGRGKLFGYFNYAGDPGPLGIYEINPETCERTLVVGTDPYRFFGLDYNPADGLLYGYTGFGSPTGLYSIDPDTGTMTHIAPSTGSANGVAVGNNTVYLAATRGEDGDPMWSYDLSQGIGGDYVEITQAFPETNAQGGATYSTGPVPGDMNCDGKINGNDIQAFVIAVINPSQYQIDYIDCTILNSDTNLDGSSNTSDVASFVQLLTGE